MIHFLHAFHPSIIIFSAGPLNIHWYGICLVTGMIAAIATSLFLAKYYKISRDNVFDLSFWLIIGGLVGARLYDILLELPYYIKYPWRTLAIWQGGLAIHGGIIAGILIVWLFARQKKIDFLKLSSLLVPGLALGQAIGRWGNYFNQELFGLPTKLPWGIPIDLLNRPAEYISASYFHPTFFYESLGCLIIFLFLASLHIWAIKKNTFSGSFYAWSLGLYVILYSILRFALEFIKIDATPLFLGMRWPQLMSLALAVSAITLLFHNHARHQKKFQK